MLLDEIQAIVIDVLREIQALSGRSWITLDPTDRPIGQLDGFDSLSAIEATVMVEQKLGCGQLRADSLFVSDDGKRALTVREIAQHIKKLLAGNGGKK